MRAKDNVFMVDGINASDPWMGQSVMNSVMNAGDAGTLLPVDAIDEFKTEENPRAEFGWKPGAVVNVGIKSGTNSLHGSAYAYGRDTALDARNYFDVAPAPKTPVALEQFGGTFGGPIKKDKLFYFANFEGQRYSIGNPILHNFPVTTSIGDPGTSLIDACLATAHAGTLTALSAELAGLKFNKATLGSPTPTGNCTPVSGQPAGGFLGFFPVNPGPGTGVYTAIANTNAINGGLGKIDYHLNDKNSFQGTYFFSEGNNLAAGNPTSDIETQWLSLLHARAQTASGSWTWTPNSTWVNEARFGYAHYYQSYFSNDHTINPANYMFNGATYVIPTGVTNPFYFGLPAISIGGLTNHNGIGQSWPKIVGPDGVFTILDHVSVLRGKQAFKFGGEILVNRSTTDVTSNAKGPVSFSGSGGLGLINFFSGNLRTASLFTGDPERHLSNMGYAAFVQDDWRIRARLTLNLGLRYEITTVVKDQNDLLGNFDPSRGILQVGHGIGSPYNGDHNNFSPRLGLAWDVQGDGKTVVRAAASIIYESSVSFDVMNGIGNLLGLRTIPTGLPLFNNGSTTALSPPGNITLASTTFTGSALAPIQSRWQAFDPTKAISATNSPLYANIASPACGDGAITAGPCSIVGVDPNFRTPYVENWNLDIQRSITSTLSLDVGYVGNHAVKLVGMVDKNQPQLVGGFSPGWGNPADPASPAGMCIASASDATPFDNCSPDPNAEQAARPFTAPCTNPGLFSALGASHTVTTGGRFNPSNSCFSYLSDIAIINNSFMSNYNGLQVTLTGRNYHGLSFIGGYTYSHSLGDASDQGTAADLSIPVNSYASVRSQLYGNSNYDLRHRGTLSVTYAIPGRTGFAQMAEGWTVNSIVLLQTGAPWGQSDLTDDFSGTGEINNAAGSQGEQWNFFGNPSDFTPVHGFTNTNCTPGAGCTGGLPFSGNDSTGKIMATCMTADMSHFSGNQQQLAIASLTNIGCYAVGNSVLVPPPYGSYGAVRRNLWHDGGFKEWDLSVDKAIKFNERLSAQFRAEFFNILNHPQFCNPNGAAGGANSSPADPSSQPFGTAGSTPDVCSGNPELGSGGSRSIQLGLKFLW